MKAESMLIQDERRSSRAQRSLHSLITLAAWTAWAYLWLPLLTLLAWFGGLRTAYVQLSAERYLRQSTDLLMILLYAAICAIVFSAWAYYNQARFARRTRRRRPPEPVPRREIAIALGAEPALGDELAQSRIATLAFDAWGHPVELLPGARDTDAQPSARSASTSSASAARR